MWAIVVVVILGLIGLVGSVVLYYLGRRSR